MSLENVEKLIRDHKVEFIDLRFADMRGVQHHVTYPVSIVDDALFEDGKMFDGSSIQGWRGIHQSDMVLLPDAGTAFLDPRPAPRPRSRRAPPRRPLRSLPPTRMIPQIPLSPSDQARRPGWGRG